MSTPDNDEVQLQQDELATIKARLDSMGVPYHPSSKLDTLRRKLQDALAGDLATAQQNHIEDMRNEDEDVIAPVSAAPVPQVESRAQRMARLRREAKKLIRIRVTCMNPQKKEWEGEIFTVGNSVVGTIKRYVPFGNDEGWHVEQAILDVMRERQCQVFTSGKSKNGVTTRQAKLIREFAIEVLPPLTQAELKELAQRQAMSHAVD